MGKGISLRSSTATRQSSPTKQSLSQGASSQPVAKLLFLLLFAIVFLSKPASAAWANTSFDRCMNITINNSGSETLTNFPAYINLTYDSDMLPDFKDIRFYNSSCNNGGNIMDYEIENYTTSSRAHIWTRIPSLPSTGKIISVYYKNNTAITNGQNASGVWDANYKMVQHFEESCATANCTIDSTQYQNNGTPYSSTTITNLFNASGKIGPAYSFDGANDFVTRTSAPTLNITGPMTICSWIKINSFPSPQADIVTYGINSGSYSFPYMLNVRDAGGGIGQTELDWGNPGGSMEQYYASSTGIAITSWQYFCAVRINSSSVKLYVNGTSIAVTSGGSDVAIPSEPTGSMYIGQLADTYFFQGSIDELRIININMSDNWVNLSYLIVANQSQYVSFGAEQSQSWANVNLDRCMNITITNSGAETLTNFPAYINLAYDSDMLADFKDIRFYDAGCSNGGSLMDYEIENYTTSSRAHIWARIPSLPSTGTVISVYYKNNTAVTSGENPTGVWDSNYIGVWHMQKVNATDSTSNTNNCTATTTTVITLNSSGKVDGSITFDGTDDMDSLNCSNKSVLNPANITIEAWINMKSTAPQYYYGQIVSKPDQYAIYQTPESTEPMLIYYGNDSDDGYQSFSSSTNLQTSTWYYLTATINPVSRRTYLNGKLNISDDSAYLPLYSSPSLLSLGGVAAGGFQEFNGTIDEVRLSNIVRSASWINQTYLMMNNQSQYVSFGAEQSKAEETNYTLNIINPTTSSPYNVDGGETINITFLFQENGANLTSGVSMNNVTIGGQNAPVLTNSVCSGTLNCGAFSTEASCNNCSQCNWTTTGSGTTTYDDCNGASLNTSKWTFISTAGSVTANGTAYLINHSTTAEMTIATNNTKNFTRVTIRGRPLKSVGNGRGHLIGIGNGTVYDQGFCNTNTGYSPSNGYAWCTANGTITTLVRLDNGVATTIDTDAWIPDYSSYYNFTLGVNSSGVYFFVNGTLILNSSDTTYSSGGYVTISTGGATTNRGSWYIDEVRDESSQVQSSCSNKTGGTCSSCAIGECNTNCSGAGCSVETTPQFGYVSGIGWVVNVTTPEGLTGSQDLFLNATYSSYTRNETEDDAINYEDTSAPVITSASVTPRYAPNGTAVNISATVTDDIGVGTVIAMIYYPNGTSAANYTMTNSGGGSVYWNASYIADFSIIGVYNITVWANDTSGNNNTGQANFTPIINQSNQASIAIDGNFGEWIDYSISSISDSSNDNEFVPVIGISADIHDRHACGLLSNGSGYCWGYGTSGRLGDGNTGLHNATSPVPINTTPNLWKNISAGYYHTCGIKLNGNLYCWGNGSLGQLGDGDTNGHDEGNPKPVNMTNNNWSMISAGLFHTCGIHVNRSLYCWGLGTYGVLGYGNESANEEGNPKPVNISINNWSYVSAGRYSTCGIHANGTAYCWGLGSFGRLGDGDENIHNATTPVAVQGGINFITITAFNQHTCGVAANGSGYCWGDGYRGKVGDGDENDHNVTSPVAINITPNNWSIISVGEVHTCGVHTNTSAYCWGEGSYGQLGNGNTDWNLFGNPQPINISNNSFSKIKAGYVTTCAIHSNGTTYCWGDGTWGRLGDGIQDPHEQGLPTTVNYTIINAPLNFEIINYSIANDNEYLFAKMSVSGSIDFRIAEKYYAIYLSTNDATTGSQYSAGGGLLPFNYDYRIQINNSACTIYNYTNHSQGSCSYSNNSNTIELSALLSLINISTGKTVNLTFETGGSSYDFAPDHNSFIQYGADAAPTWANSDLTICRNITIHNSGEEELIDFPAYINLSYDSDMLPEFTDIRFYMESCNKGDTALDYEIENYTTSTNAHVWIRIPRIPSTGTVISLYYKNNTAISDGQNPTGVWDSNYVGVWHMQRVNASDSTINANNGTAVSSAIITLNTTGKIDGAVNFDGSEASHFINCSNNSVLNPENITMEAWIYMKAVNPPGVGGPIMWKYPQYSLTQSGGSSHPEFSLCNATACVSATASAWASLDLSRWYYIVATYKTAALATYLDGAYHNTRTDMTGPLNTSINNFMIGGHNYGNEFNGTIDEVRISNTVRSASWINQTYLMMNNQSDYVTFGDEIAMINSCQNLTSANTYYMLTQNVTNPATCFNVTASNITLDCRGYSITYGTGSAYSYGVMNNLSKDNVTVKNCIVTIPANDYCYPVYFKDARGGTILNNSMTNTYFGVYIYNSSGLVIENNTINNTMYGPNIELYTGSDNVTIRNNTLIKGTTNNWPWWEPENIYISASRYARLYNNTMTNPRWNGIQVFSYYTSDPAYYNHTIGIDNTVNGKPIMYIANVNNTVYRDYNWSGYDVLIGANNNVTFTNLTLSSIFFSDDFINGEFSNSTITSTNITPLHLRSVGVTNNFVVKNNIISYSGSSPAVALSDQSSGLTFINNTITQNGTAYAAFYQDAGGSGTGCHFDFINNTINATGSIGYYSAPGYGSRNIISGNTITTGGSGEYGIYLAGRLNYSYVTNNRITSSGDAIRNYLPYSSYYGEKGSIIVNDSFLNSTGSAEIYMYDSVGGPMNLTNVTLAHENISFSSSGNQTINRLWYVEANITDKAGNAITSVNITINDKDLLTWYNGLTNTSGQIPRQVLRQYWMNRTNSYYYSNYTLNATRRGYVPNYSVFNLTTNKKINLILSGLPLSINISINPAVVNSSETISLRGHLNDSNGLGVPNQSIRVFVNNTEYTYNSGTGMLQAGTGYSQPTTDSSGDYNYNFAAPITAGNYIVKVNTTNVDYNAQANTTLTVEEYHVYVSINLTPSIVNISQNFTVYGHINDSDGNNITNTTIYIYIDNVLANITGGSWGGTAWWNSDWKYRTKIYEESYVSTSLNSTIIMLNFSTSNLISQNKVRSDCGDIRFTDSSKNELQYTLETSTCNTTNTIIWVWTNLTGNTNNTIYAYYGNSAATLKTDYTNPDDKLLLYLHFDNSSAYGENSTKVFDFSKKGYNGTCNSTNCSTWNSTGKYGGAYNFDGVNDYYTLPLMRGVNNFSFSIWLKPKQTNDNTIFFSTIGPSSAGWAIAMDRDYWPCTYGTICAWLVNSGGSGGYVDYAYNFTPDEWTHWVVTYNSQNTLLQMYINGVLMHNESTGYTPYTDAVTETYLGKGPDGWSPTDHFFNGTMDEIRIYNRSLSSDEILAIYNSTKDHYIANETGTATDSNGNYNYTVQAPGAPGDYTVKVNVSYNYNTAENTATLTVLDAGVIITNVNANPRYVINGTVVNISATVTTGIGSIDKVIARIRYPGGTSAANYTMTNSGGGSTYWNASYVSDFSIPGKYNFTIYANKTNGISNESNYYNFTPILNQSNNATITIDGVFTDWSSASVPEISDYATDTTHESFASAYIFTGEQYTCGILSNGSGYCWGFGNDGQLGDGNSSAHNATVPVPINMTPNNWSKISTAKYHTCGIASNGSLYCWGNDYQGRLGNGNLGGGGANPSPVNISQNNFTQVSVSFGTSCAIHANGSSYCWGEGSYGKLGDGNVSSHEVDSPQPVNTSIIFTKISAGTEHTCAVATNGSAYCWGHGLYGRLGDGEDEDHNATIPTPVQFANNNWTIISAGGDHTCGIVPNGTAYCWGRGEDGQLGDGSVGEHNYTTPNPVNFTNNNFTTISAGSGGHTCAIAVNGSAYCWGLSNSGELGDGYVGWNQRPNPNPLNFTNNNFTAISAGYDHSCGITVNGSAYCWGGGAYGRLGNGDETYQDVGLPSHVNYSFVNLAPNFEITSYSLAHDDDYVYARMSVSGSIDFSNATKYYSVYLSTNDASTGSSYSVGGASLPFNYDYRLQLNNSACAIYNYTNQSQGSCDYSSTGGTLELRANLTLIGISSDSIINITTEAGSSTSSYDSAPDYDSFIEYTVTQEVPIPPAIYFVPPTDNNSDIISRNWSLVNVTVTSSYNTSAFIDWNRSLVGWWSFESYNATGIYDNSTYNNFVWFNGGINTSNITTGKYGNALWFDGSDDSLQTESDPGSEFDFNSGDSITITFWAKPEQLRNYDGFIDKGANFGIQMITSEVYNGPTLYFNNGTEYIYYMAVSDYDKFTIDEWTYVAFSYTFGSGASAKFYINGQSAEGTWFGNGDSAPIIDSSSPVKVGEAGPGENFKGLLDEVRIFRRILSPEEVNASFNAGAYRLYNNFTDLEEGTYNFTAYAIDEAGNINQTEERSITYSTATPPPAIYFTEPTDDNLETINRIWSYVNVTVDSEYNTSAFIDWNRSLVGWWNFESYNTTGIYDNSTYSNFANFSGGISTGDVITGKRGNALDFNGSGQRIRTENKLITTNEVTVCAWIKPNISIGVFQLPSIVDTADFAFFVYVNNNPTETIGVSSDNGGTAVLADTHAITLGEWQHVCVKRLSDGSATFYVNGAQSGAADQDSGTPTNTIFEGTTIGANFQGSYPFNGTIDEVMIFNRSLSPAEINASFDAGAFRLYKNFTDLAEGTYNFTAYAIDESGNINKTEERSITVQTAPPSELKYTVMESGGNFTNLSAAVDYVAANHPDLVADNVYVVIEIDGTWTNPDTTPVYISDDSIITDETHYLSIYTTPEARHNGKWNNTKYRLEVNDDMYAFRSGVDNIMVDGLQIRETYNITEGSTSRGFLQMSSGSGKVYISNNIVVGNITYSGGGSAGIETWDTGTTYTWNNIVYNFGDCIWPDSQVNSYVYNNLAYNCGVGFYTYYQDVIAKNNIGYNNTENYFTDFNSASDNNLAGPTLSDAPGSNPHNATFVSFVNLTSGFEDFHLASNDTGAKDQGIDLSADSYFNFTTDIDNQTRTGTWDIGPDEYVATSTELTGCANLTDANTVYTLLNNVNSSDTCFNIWADNITLDGQGFLVNFSTSAVGYGVNITGNNSLVKNLAIIEGSTSNDYMSAVRITGRGATFSDSSIIPVSYGAGGVYVAGNNSLLQNLTVTTNAQGAYGLLAEDSANHRFLNNTILTSEPEAWGMYLSSATNSTLSGNNVSTSADISYYLYGTTASHYNHTIGTSNLAEGLPIIYNFSLQNTEVYANQNFNDTYGQVICGWCSNVTYRNISIRNDGISFFNSSSASVINSSFSTTNGHCIYFSYSSDGLVKNNNFYLNSYHGAGVFSRNSQGTTVTEASIIIDMGQGVYLQSDNDATFANSTITKTSEYFYALAAVYTHNVTISNITSLQGAGIYVGSEFSAVIERSSFIGDAAQVYSNYCTLDITARDTVINSTGAEPDIEFFSTCTEISFNFTNVTRSDGSHVNISWGAGVDGTVNYAWWLDANITSGGSALDGATVNATSTLGTIKTNTTGASGLTRMALLEYTRNNTGGANITYYSNYTINASKAGYSSNSTIVNMTTNRFISLVLTSTSSCICPGAATNWNIDMTHSCNITSNCDITTGYLNFTNTGYARFNATVNCTGMQRPAANQIIYIEKNALILVH